MNYIVCLMYRDGFFDYHHFKTLERAQNFISNVKDGVVNTILYEQLVFDL